VDGQGREVKEFGATTAELEKMVAWLQERKVVSVAMESTGVYWIPPQEVLERHGLEVVLVDARELALVPGRRKTDRLDCKWIQRLHSCGLLRGSFRPKEQINMLRTLVRDKGTLVAERADWIRRMQKSLDQMNVRVRRAVADIDGKTGMCIMNVRVHRAVADIDGKTGMCIIRAIIAGERNADALAKFRDPRCRLSEAQIAEQLSGHWREDHLFSLAQALKMYDAIEERVKPMKRRSSGNWRRWSARNAAGSRHPS